MNDGENLWWAFVGLMRRQSRLASAAMCATLGAFAIAFVIAQMTYSATALLFVGVLNKWPDVSSISIFPIETKNAIVDSEIEILRSNTTLVRAISSLDVPWENTFEATHTEIGGSDGFQSSDNSAGQTTTAATLPSLRQVRAATTIERIGATYLVAITVRVDEPVLAAQLANAILESHIAARAPYAMIPVVPVSWAQEPDEPDGPAFIPFFGLALLVGLMLSIGSAIAREAMTRGITSGNQLSSIAQRPVLGAIPRMRMPRGMQSPSQFVVHSPLSGFSEAVRQIRAGIERHTCPELLPAPGTKGQVIMIASPLAEDGKTSVALALARTYAVSGKRTLLIDCDLRRPSIHRHLGVEPPIGLFEYLSDQHQTKALSSLIVIDSDTGLSVVVGSRQSEIPTENLVLNQRFERLISAAIANFEIIVIDTPPVLPVVDGLYLARYADTIVTVVKVSSTSQLAVKNTIARLDESRRTDARLFTVLNQHDDFADRFTRSAESYNRG